MFFGYLFICGFLELFWCFETAQRLLSLKVKVKLFFLYQLKKTCILDFLPFYFFSNTENIIKVVQRGY